MGQRRWLPPPNAPPGSPNFKLSQNCQKILLEHLHPHRAEKAYFGRNSGVTEFFSTNTPLSEFCRKFAVSVGKLQLPAHLLFQLKKTLKTSAP